MIFMEPRSGKGTDRPSVHTARRAFAGTVVVAPWLALCAVVGALWANRRMIRNGDTPW